jgi:hypothetical protein
MVSQYKYILVDEDNHALRKFASKIEAQPYLSQGYQLIKLPKQPSPYHTAMLLLGEAPF